MTQPLWCPTQHDSGREWLSGDSITAADDAGRQDGLPAAVPAQACSKVIRLP